MIDIFTDVTRKRIAKFIQNEADRIIYNAEIFTILEGNVKVLLEQKMKDDLGQRSFDAAKFRQAPINVFRKIIDKLTNIYQSTVIRSVVDGNDSDEKLLRWYEEQLNMNRKMNISNEFFNAYLYNLIHIGLTNINPVTGMGKPFIRSIPNHEFLVMNDSETDPTSADVIIVFMGKCTIVAQEHHIFWVFTDSQFAILNQEGDIMLEQMRDHEQDGMNILGTVPMIYTNNSDNQAMPGIQTDNKDMTLLIPLLLTDLNYAVKYQCFSIFVAINLQDKSIELSPNSILSFASDGTAEGGSSFQAVKPTVDISAVLSLASSQMSLWLTSKGLRPGAVGTLGVDQFASGISKMIDDSDTYESIKKQINTYVTTEAAFWEKLMHQIHPKWVSRNLIDNKTLFSPKARVVTTFTKPIPLQSRGEMVKDTDLEVKSGFISRKRAIKKLNPEMPDAEIELLIKEIDEEKPFIDPLVENKPGVVA